MEMKFNLFNANKLTINIVLEHNNKLIIAMNLTSNTQILLIIRVYRR